jgi:hypothetical protein
MSRSTPSANNDNTLVPCTEHSTWQVLPLTPTNPSAETVRQRCVGPLTDHVIQFGYLRPKRVQNVGHYVSFLVIEGPQNNLK